MRSDPIADGRRGTLELDELVGKLVPEETHRERAKDDRGKEIAQRQRESGNH
jgi:hypothetical protein